MPLQQADVRELLEAGGQTCVSIYMPGEPAGPDTQQGPIRLKNLLRIATEKLIERGYDEPQARQFLQPAAELLEQPDYWQHQNHGLAFFIADNFFREYRLPITFDELVLVDDQFHIKPLLPLLYLNGRFYILALSQQDVRLYEATLENIEEVTLRGVPRTLRDVVGYDYEERSLQFHTGTQHERSMRPGDGMRRPAIYFGHGENVDQDRQEIERFSRRVDESLYQLIPDRQTPMILATVDYVAAIYRDVSTYPNLLEEGIAGNVEHLSADELHKLALPIMERQCRKARDEAVERFASLYGTAGVSDELQTILSAAFEGRIDTLFVASDEQMWGRFDEVSRWTEQHDERQPGDTDLLQLATVKALDSGARVVATPRDELPAAPLAAVFRY